MSVLTHPVDIKCHIAVPQLEIAKLDTFVQNWIFGFGNSRSAFWNVQFATSC